MSTASFRSNRIIIASLFLPNTVVIGFEPSGKSTPVPGRHPGPPLAIASNTGPDATEVVLRLKGDAAGNTTGVISQAPNKVVASKNTPLKSIVEDLKDRAMAPRIATKIGSENLNPFSNLASITTPAATSPNSPHSRAASLSKAATTTPVVVAPPMVQSPSRRRSKAARRNSRSSSRRPEGSLVAEDSREEIEQFFVEPNPHCNGGLKNAIESVSTVNGRITEANRLRKKLFVGTLGAPSQNSFSPLLKQGISSRMRGEHEGEVVWIDDNTFDAAYDGFCHQVLWPALHYAVPDAPRTKLFYESASFKDYVAVNQQFADTIKGIWREGDVVWVNDYHLMLLPAMLRAPGMIPPTAPIGFFLHVSFPSSEIFRCLSVRESLLRGMLGADLIGFQTGSYARHFRQTVSRILSVEALPRGIQLPPEFDLDENGNRRSLLGGLNGLINKILPKSTSGAKGRFVDVGVFPMGIDVAQLKEKKREPDVDEWISSLKARYAGMKILVGRDKLDEIQGVRQKIQAFEVFLDKYPEYQGKVVLIQIALPTSSPESSTSNQPLSSSYSVSSQILSPISHINSRFSTLTYQPVVFLHTQEVTFSQYLALLSVADAFVVTSLREGMALRSHEFVVMQEGQGRERPLILSEFTGSYSYSGFRSCIAINPWDARGTATAIHQALTMPEDEAHSRWEDLHNHVVTQTAQAFVTSFLTRCLRANTEHIHGHGREQEVPDLSQGITKVMGRWRHSDRRLVLIDWEGTLYLAGDKGSQEFDDAIQILKKLSEDTTRNEVWLLSGLPVKGSLEKIAKEVPKIGIVSENGCFIRPRPNRAASSPGWINMVSNVNMTWKTPCLDLLNYYTERTPGSKIEEREASIVWRFWTGAPNDDCSDRQWARRQAAEAQNHIFDSLGERYALRLIPGSNSFLVIPNNVSRSTAVGAILQLEGPAHSPISMSSRPPWMSPVDHDVPTGSDDLDFVLSISGDEKLLRRLNDMDNSETCSTSGRGTDAKWKLEPGQVTDVLRKFADVR